MLQQTVCSIIYQTGVAHCLVPVALDISAFTLTKYMTFDAPEPENYFKSKLPSKNWLPFKKQSSWADNTVTKFVQKTFDRFVDKGWMKDNIIRYITTDSLNHNCVSMIAQNTTQRIYLINEANN